MHELNAVARARIRRHVLGGVFERAIVDISSDEAPIVRSDS